MKILNHLKPDIFHLHHRFGFWWMLESAQRLGIPTIYTNYDWGIACLRTVLVNGEGEICDGHINPEKCSACIQRGRTKYFARINEALVNLSIGEKLLSIVENINPNSDFFRSRGVVTKSSFNRTSIHQGRLKTVINQLNQLITPSKFGKDFFGQFGISRNNVTILPWFHDVSDVDKKSSKKNGGMILTYIGRLSPEKGVHLIFEALELLNDIPMITLRVNSYNDSDYCRNLREKYKSSAGKHHVIWNKWNADWLNVLDSFRTTDLVIIPSNCMDNTPLVFIESMAYKVPVIATRIPTMSDFENNENVCYFADFNSAESFSVAIRRALSNLKLIRKGGQNFPSIPTSIQYCDEIYKIYKKML
jgi:glycosyltransferase involved in cell wall biosynthesis